MVAFLSSSLLEQAWGRTETKAMVGKKESSTSGQLELPWNHITHVHQKPTQSCAKNIQCVTNTHSSLTQEFPYTSKPRGGYEKNSTTKRVCGKLRTRLSPWASLLPVNFQAILSPNIPEIHETAGELWIGKAVSSPVEQSLLNLIKQSSLLQRFTWAAFTQEASRSLLWQKLIYSHITESILAAWL